MAQSFSDYSVGSESDSSKDETIYDTIRATAEKPSRPRMEESQGNTLVIRVAIPDLQQTVSSPRLPRPPRPQLAASTWLEGSGAPGPPWTPRAGATGTALLLPTQPLPQPHVPWSCLRSLHSLWSLCSCAGAPEAGSFVK